MRQPERILLPYFYGLFAAKYFYSTSVLFILKFFFYFYFSLEIFLQSSFFLFLSPLLHVEVSPVLHSIIFSPSFDTFSFCSPQVQFIEIIRRTLFLRQEKIRTFPFSVLFLCEKWVLNKILLTLSQIYENERI